MMGNIFARHKDDISTAMKYYEKAMENNPKDNIALNNIGANLMQLGRAKEALIYFEKAIELNPDYPNTHYALAMLDEIEGNHQGAFSNSLTAIRKNTGKDGLFNKSMQTAINAAQQLIAAGNGLGIVKAYTAKLEFEFETPITIQEDSSIPTAAKTEFAENHNRKNHIIKYKPEYPAIHHLIMHELVHLEFASQARQKGNNQLFVSDNENKKKFIQTLEHYAIRLNKKGYSAEMLSDYFGALFNGLNQQIYNTPIDLFIEDFLYEKYDELHSFQFVSLLALIQEGIQATTDKKIVDLTPSWVLSKSKVYNIINALHFRTLFGVDLINEHKPTRTERELAESLYKEFSKYDGKEEPGIEYGLVQKWANKLKLENYFSLINESSYRSSKSTGDILDSIKLDHPIKEGKSQSQQEEMDTFMAAHEDKDLNMAVMWFMVDALQYFKNLDDSAINRIAIEIANIGVNGIRPESKNYTVPSIKGKRFSGYHLLAYYYVSWAHAIPDMLNSLSLPFDNEYEMAMEFDAKSNG